MEQLHPAFIDTLSFTFKPDFDLVDFGTYDPDNFEFVSAYFNSILDPLGLMMGQINPGGRNFYKYSALLDFQDDVRTEDLEDPKAIGFIAWGGNAGSVQVYLSGFACDYLNRNDLMLAVHRLCTIVGAKLTRVDTAIDCFDGEYTVDDAVDWWHAKAYSGKGNHPKQYSQAGRWLDGVERTFYVGSRKSVKYFRAYEKGHQLGDLDSKWTRFEIEWKANCKAVLPLDMLLCPGRYLSESYDCMSWVPDDDQDGSTESVKYRIKKQVKLTVSAAVENAKQQYGKLINALAEIGFDHGTIVASLRRDGVPARLLCPPEWAGHDDLEARIWG